MSWKKRAVSMESLSVHHSSLVQKNINGRDHLGDLDVDGILKCIKNELM
jgi:hypothetical protein